MRKIQLESLHVESFETTAAAPEQRGTVRANADTKPTEETCVYMCTSTIPAGCSQHCTWNTCEGCILLTEYDCAAP